ncbi:hypothetical protein KEJ37_03735 [Candidatus Bathyarchaeota archaeon]|nr:hypothetical protein [Candidatus Bathyarchaeota archaeon]
MKKLTAIIHVDAETQEITAYKIQPKGEEGSLSSFPPKNSFVSFWIAAAISVALHLALKC